MPAISLLTAPNAEAMDKRNMAVPISSLSLACLAPMLVVRAQGSIIAEIKGRRETGPLGVRMPEPD